MSRIKTWTLAVFATVTLIVAVQNTEAVDTRLLFTTVTMPRALLLIITLLVGVVIGLFAGLRLSSPKSSAGGERGGE